MIIVFWMYLQVGVLGQAAQALIVEALAGESRNKHQVGTVKEEVAGMMGPVTRVVTAATPGTTTLKTTGKHCPTF